MAAKKRELALVSQRELAKAVNKAVELAARQHKLKLESNLFERDLIKTPPWIFGRVLRGQVDLDQAYKAAETITSNVKFADAEFQPVALRINRDILVGFIERFGDRVQVDDFLIRGDF
jgi:hypothetical protein